MYIHLFASWCKKIIFNKTQFIDEDTYLFFDNLSSNYYHWFTESLPRLFAANGKIENRTCILPHNLNDFQERSLSYLDLSKKSFIHENNLLKVKNMVFLPYVGTADEHNAEIIESIKNFYISKIVNSNIKPFRLLFLSREKAGYRKILNEKAIRQIMETHKFEVICAEDYSFEEQVNIFRGVEVLISPHGAGLTNMIFMNAHTTVVELLHPNYLNFCYRNLAVAKNITHHHIVGNSDESIVWNWNGDFRIEGEKIKNLLKIITL